MAKSDSDLGSRGGHLCIEPLRLFPTPELCGAVQSPVKAFDRLRQGELAAFNPSNAAIEFKAQTAAEFVLGSAVPHGRDLVLGPHSVQTTAKALQEAEARIATIQARLLQQGRP